MLRNSLIIVMLLFSSVTHAGPVIPSIPDGGPLASVFGKQKQGSLLGGFAKEDEPVKKETTNKSGYRSIFDADLDSLSIEICCPKKFDPNTPFGHLPPVTAF
jgi:hypothetical protein